jgi:NAD-dependent SIR2 family protein deacetylase
MATRKRFIKKFKLEAIWPLWVERAERVDVLTSAGISIESGIPDFPIFENQGSINHRRAAR